MHFVLVFTVFCASLQGSPGGRGAGTSFSSSDVFCLCPFALVFTVFFAHSHFFFRTMCIFPWFLQCFLASWRCFCYAGHWCGVGGMLTFHITCSRGWCYVTLGWGGMLTFHVTCSRCWCYATLGWGGDVNVPYNLLTWLMLRHAGVGGMLTFHVTCSRGWCYATLGWGGVLTFHITCSRGWCYATLGWGGMLTFHITCSRGWCYATLGWGGDVNVPYNLLTWLMLRHAGVGGMLTFHVTCSRCWCYATLGWGGC